MVVRTGNYYPTNLLSSLQSYIVSLTQFKCGENCMGGEGEKMICLLYFFFVHDTLRFSDI